MLGGIVRKRKFLYKGKSNNKNQLDQSYIFIFKRGCCHLYFGQINQFHRWSEARLKSPAIINSAISRQCGLVVKAPD